MKKLFTVGTVPFDNKMKAKEHRDKTGHPLKRGPDHMGVLGCRGVPHKHAEARKGLL